MEEIKLCKEDPKYLGNNKIGDEGCLHLSKTHWPNLRTIDLSKEYQEYLAKNQIGDQGCLHLSKAYWLVL